MPSRLLKESSTVGRVLGDSDSAYNATEVVSMDLSVVELLKSGITFLTEKMPC